MSNSQAVSSSNDPNGAGILSKNDGRPLTGIKRPGRSVDYFRSSSAEGKLGWSYTSCAAICLHGTDWRNCTHYMSSVRMARTGAAVHITCPV
jgi:hypothetical protein